MPSPPLGTAPKEPSFVVALACGIAAGVGAAALTNPFDVIRTRIQVGGAGTPDSAWLMARRIAATEGPSGFCRGLFARTLLLAPTSSLTVALFTACKGAIEGRVGEGEGGEWKEAAKAGAATHER